MRMALLLMIVFCLSCDYKPRPYHLTKNMIHVSTEWVSFEDDEKIDIYRDLMNNNVCYVYHSGHGQANMSCVKDEMAFTR